jgi:chemotaxis receptor (MCP) glutamine deamidase CheD
VRAALAKERVPVVAAETGGSKGRTIRVVPGGAVLSKEAGGAEIELMPGVRS